MEPGLILVMAVSIVEHLEPIPWSLASSVHHRDREEMHAEQPGPQLKRVAVDMCGMGRVDLGKPYPQEIERPRPGLAKL